MSENTFALLRCIINETQCKPGWIFSFVEEDGAASLFITIAGQDNYHPERRFTVNHVHPVPNATYNEKTWRRWIFEQCRRTMNHELGESLRFGVDEVRPFAPMHGPGEDPYTVHEIRPEADALTTQNGSLREGPV